MGGGGEVVVVSGGRGRGLDSGGGVWIQVGDVGPVGGCGFKWGGGVVQAGVFRWEGGCLGGGGGAEN